MFRRIVFLHLLCSVFSNEALAQDSACLFAANQPATVQIDYRYTTNEGSAVEKGTGFIVSPSGHVITNAHVVSPRLKDVDVLSSEVQVRIGSLFNPPISANVLVRDQAGDLALLLLSKPIGIDTWPTVTIGSITNLPVGAPLNAMGFSGGDLAIVPGGQKTAANTVVDGELKPWWQTNLTLNAGNSGGPIFGSLGTVIGISVAKSVSGQAVTYIIPINRAQHLLDAAIVPSAKYGRCAVFPECRHESHGFERYTIDEELDEWGEWRSGGYNRPAFCNDLQNKLKSKYPVSLFEFVKDDEQSRDVGYRQFEYRYYCKFRRLETPIFKLRRSEKCLP